MIPTVHRFTVLNVIVNYIKDRQPEEQAGVRDITYTIDNIFTIKVAMEKGVKRNRETHTTLIDLGKAYDIVMLLLENKTNSY